MKMIRIILALSLGLVLSLGLAGCNGGEVADGGAAGGGEGLAQAEIDQIVAGVTTAQYDSAKMDFDTNMVMEVIGGAEPIEMTMWGNGTGIMDMVNQEMQMSMDMTMDIPEMGEQAMTTQVYLVGDWMYTGIEIPDFGDQWFKTEVMPGTWEQQNQLEQQIAFFRESVGIEYLGMEAVEGTDCYVFDIVPSMEALEALLAQQSSAMGTMDFSQLDLADLFEEMRIKEWVAGDSYRVLKSEVYMRMQMLPEDVGASESDFDRMVMDMDMTSTMYDYDQPVSIDLPEEALDAEEMPY